MTNPRFQIRKQHNSNKTIRMPDGLIEKLQKLADDNNTSFNQVVVQCCEFALKNLSNTEN
ncbi:MAG: hypothetical protein IK108_00850 [Clostridia bacterium]|nr:hypothetical protein [Clostridia bacterium]